MGASIQCGTARTTANYWPCKIVFPKTFDNIPTVSITTQTPVGWAPDTNVDAVTIKEVTVEYFTCYVEYEGTLIHWIAIAL